MILTIFFQNDEVYRELASHDKKPEIAWRTQEEMESEAVDLKRHLETINLE
jgi:hypothetical protein